jgi:dienelactone hydrolase
LPGERIDVDTSPPNRTIVLFEFHPPQATMSTQQSSRTFKGALSAAALLALTACGGGGDDSDALDLSNDRGSIVRNPPTQLASLSNLQFSGSLRASAAGQQLLALTGVEPTAGNVKCGIDVRYLQYGTVGGAAEKTNATGALILPTGGAGCTGPRPIVLYAHGTTVDKNYNMALVSTNSEAALVAATFAANGYIVVAPNYAGYEASKLGYHPYLNADQQSKDMIDALAAARKAIAKIGNGTTDSGQILINGYSQGGHVAMATHRALQAAGVTVTASSGGSGPYALGKLIDTAVARIPIVGATIFTPMMATSWQRAYGNVYATAADMYNPLYASGIEALLPGSLTTTQLFTQARLPSLALIGDSPALVRGTFGDAAAADALANACTTGPASCSPLQPANGLRRAAYRNDLRSWTPGRPVMMCGGNQDPTVPFASTQLTQAYFTSQLGDVASAQLVRVVDVHGVPTFQGALDQVAAAAGATAASAAASAGGDLVAQATASATASATARVSEYHATVAPFCVAAAASFFSVVLQPAVAPASVN